MGKLELFNKNFAKIYLACYRLSQIVDYNEHYVTLPGKMTYQLAHCSVSRLFNVPILAYFWNFIGWGNVIRLRNISDWWAAVNYA